jgi:hypothetical protein
LCIKQLNVGERILEICALCKTPLGPVNERARPSPKTGGLLSRALSPEGLLTAAAIAVLDAGLVWIPRLGTFVHVVCTGAVVAYYFQIIAHIGDGKPGLPGPSDAMEDIGDLRRQSTRGWVCVLAAALPFIIWRFLNPGVTPEPAVAASLAALGLLYLPAAIVCVVLTGSTWGAVYPIAWIQVILRAPASYVRLLGVFVLSLGTLSLVYFGGRAAIGWIPFLGTFIIDTVVAMALFAQAALVGGFLMRHAEDFGYA